MPRPTMSRRTKIGAGTGRFGTDNYWDVLGQILFGTFWDILGRFGTDWDVLGQILFGMVY